MSYFVSNPRAAGLEGMHDGACLKNEQVRRSLQETETAVASRRAGIPGRSCTGSADDGFSAEIGDAHTDAGFVPGGESRASGLAANPLELSSGPRVAEGVRHKRPIVSEWQPRR